MIAFVNVGKSNLHLRYAIRSADAETIFDLPPGAADYGLSWVDAGTHVEVYTRGRKTADVDLASLLPSHLVKGTYVIPIDATGQVFAVE